MRVTTAHLLPSEVSLIAAIGDDRPYFRPTCDGKVAYLAGPGAREFVAKAHTWLPEYEIEVDGRTVGTRKTAKGALTLLIRLADKEYRSA